jgi:hypothetical protein
MKKADPINHYCSKISKSLVEFHGIKLGGSKNLDTFTTAFIEAFLMDVNENEKQRSKEEREDEVNLHLIDYELRDIDPRSLKKIIKDCDKFQNDNIEAIEKGGAGLNDIYERAGYDFYYTRVGHGVGFWETDKWEDPYGKELTSAAKKFGSIDGYAGDDNKIYIMGAEGDWTAKGAITGVNVPKEEKPYKDSYGDDDDDEINEGGAKLSKDGMVTGQTSDMIGNWTIGAFNTKHSNKKETPQMREDVSSYTPIIKQDEDSKFINICAWCDPDKKLTDKLETKGWRVSHGMCKKHYEEEMGHLPPIIKEAIYDNNAGIMEVFEFFKKASDEEKEAFDNLLNSGQEKAAWNLIEKVLGVKFKGSGPWA